MYVRSYLVCLILGCTVCGLAVFFIHDYFFHHEELAAKQASNSTLALRDLESLESGFSQWMLLSDLVIGSDVSYLTDGVLRLSDELSETIERIRDEFVDPVDDIGQVEKFLLRQRSRLEETQKLTANQRENRLQELLDEMDIDSVDCIEAIESLRIRMQDNQQQLSSKYKALLNGRPLRTTGLLLGFLLVAAGMWRWISQMLSKPLFQLTKESRQAKREQRQINLVTSGPIEIQQLSQSLSELVIDLQEQITELQRSRTERERLHTELMETSRKAGMAEVASEVLHNVGNVLNSINVSASVIDRQLRESVLSRMQKVNELIAEHSDDLSGFLKNDKRGTQLPQAIDLLTNRLASEHENQREEIKLLQDSIEHVRVVIQNQQAFARGTNLIEPICVNDIIEEAIRINQVEIKASGIGIVRKYAAEIKIESDRHKLQQILINLVSNAVDATMSAKESVNPVIKILMSTSHNDVCIQLVDNGVGIPRDKLETIFSHGFTTKKDGHGFGLHSSAIAAKVLGGSLLAESRGLGTGATFTLTLPIESNESNISANANLNSNANVILPVETIANTSNYINTIS